MKIVISGYYGHGNFGDEAILRVIFAELKKNFENAEITVLSKIPNLKAIADCDIFVSGGGSLLQDVTSLKSLLYYLGLLYMAVILKKKTIIYSQGIGPINSNLGKKLTAYVLKNVDLITVRDKESVEFLKSLNIDSNLTGDPVWELEYNPVKTEKNKINVGIQLRKWPALDEAKLKTLAYAITSSFKGQDIILNLISLQDKNDLEVLNSFREMINGIETKVLTGLTLDETIDCICNLDYLIAMRYHACLVAAKYSVPFLAITYDPKVKILAKETTAPFVSVKDMNFSMLNNAIKYLITEKNRIQANLREISIQKAEQALMSPFFVRLFKPDAECDHGKTSHEKVNSK